jgi:hypothetical protein
MLVGQVLEPVRSRECRRRLSDTFAAVPVRLLCGQVSAMVLEPLAGDTTFMVLDGEQVGAGVQEGNLGL